MHARGQASSRPSSSRSLGHGALSREPYLHQRLGCQLAVRKKGFPEKNITLGREHVAIDLFVRELRKNKVCFLKTGLVPIRHFHLAH